MKVSVAVPAYNEEGFLEKCLQSLRRQTVPVEIVVCDNNSTDRTYEIAKKYADRVVKERRQGVVFAFNAAAMATTGELIAFTGADCIVPPDWIEKFLPCFNNPKTIACFGPVRALEDRHRKTFRMFSIFHMSLVKLKLSWGISDANMIMRKKILERVGYFDPNVKMLEDSWLFKRIRRYGKIKFLRNNIVKTSVRRVAKEGKKRILADRTIALVKMKVFKSVGDERFKTVR